MSLLRSELQLFVRYMGRPRVPRHSGRSEQSRNRLHCAVAWMSSAQCEFASYSGYPLRTADTKARAKGAPLRDWASTRMTRVSVLPLPYSLLSHEYSYIA